MLIAVLVIFQSGGIFMFEKYYGFTGRPFQLTPDPSFFFNSKVHEKAAAYLLFGLDQGEGFVVLTGEVGAGKTTLLRHLLAHLDKDHFCPAQIETSQLGADDLLRMVALAFGVTPTSDKASLLGAIQTFLETSHRAGRRCLLLIDEAQNLSIAALEELRMLSNFQIGETSLMQSFLVGQPQFRATLASADLEQLRQRVIATYHLGPLSDSETAAYIDHRLQMAGWRHDPRLGQDCLSAVFRRSGGIPRRVNTLMSRLLLFGFLEELHDLTAAMVDIVADDLGAEISFAGTAANATAGDLACDMDQRLQALDARIFRHDVALMRTLGLFADLVAH